MDYNKTQTNSQQTPAQPRAAVVGAPAAKSSSAVKRVSVAVLGLLVVLGLIAAGLFMALGKDGADSGTTAVDKDKYQAVFMTNGQVYFGKLDKLKSNYSELTDVYYLQVQQAVQPADTKTASTEQPQVSLTKLGNELHGPTDRMHISKDQILFWENLKDDSTVVKAIKDYKNKQQ